MSSNLQEYFLLTVLISASLHISAFAGTSSQPADYLSSRPENSLTMSRMQNQCLFPGSTSLSDSIFVFEPATIQLQKQSAATSPTRGKDPAVIILFAWGDALPKHVIKYIDGYRALFPMARVVLITGSFYTSMSSSRKALVDAVMPAIQSVYGSPEAAGERILLHAMSNVGITAYVSSLMAYQKYVGSTSARLPHVLLVLDSTPGSAAFDPLKWATALAYGWKDYSPLPIVAMQVLYFIFVTLRYLVTITRYDADFRLRTGPNDTRLTSTSAPRLYLYGTKDGLISWKMVEKHAAEARKEGFKCDMELFGNSDHVGHMRKEPERYWGAINNAWKNASKL